MDRTRDSQAQGMAYRPAVETLTTISDVGRESRGLWGDAWARLLRNPVAMAGGAVVIALIVVAIAAPCLAPYGPIRQDLASSLAGPSMKHLAGTDVHGRDIFSRIIHGIRISLRIGFLGMLLGCIGGVVLGLVAGYYGGWADTIIMRLMDVQLAFPGLLVAVCIIAIIGPGLENVIVAVGIFSVPLFARVTRGQILSLKAQEFIVAARMMGAQDGRIMLNHLLPNAVAPLLVPCTLRIATAILTAASLSFLGLGLQAPVVSWGVLLRDAQDLAAIGLHPWLLLPALWIVVTVLMYNFLGDGLRDAADPYK